jgi:hypothetical protein
VNKEPAELNPESAPLSRDQFLSATLSELGLFFLDVHCTGCTKVTTFPLQLMATKAKHGRRLRLQDAIARMRCSQCAGAPATIVIQDRAVAPGPGYIGDAATWRVRLVP